MCSEPGVLRANGKRGARNGGGVFWWGDKPGPGKIPVWMPHLQKRLLSEKPVAPTICPITCTSAMTLGGEKYNDSHVRYVYYFHLTDGETEVHHDV